MDSKYLLELMLIFVLQFQGISGKFIYSRPGQDVTLPCRSASPNDTTCSMVNWLYNKDQAQTFAEVLNGKVEESSARAARLSVATDCSLVINNITAEEFGLYTCRQGESNRNDEVINLSVLTISQSPPDTSEVTLNCSLSRYDISCGQNSLRWLDDTGAELRGEGDSFRVLRQTGCVSRLIVKRQSGDNRRYTCLFVEGDKVEIEADYTPDVTADSTDRSPLIYGMFALRIAVLILMTIITAIVIRNRCNTKQLDDDNNGNDEGDVHYENC